MTGRTHDLAALTALTYTIATQPLPEMSLATALVAFTANMVGGLAPDIDQPTADLYHRLRGGSFIGKLITPLLGGHRFISHSIFGVFLFGWVSGKLLELMHTVVLVDIHIVWWAFMIGFVSHLFADLFTHDGVPLLFPIPLHFGIPPLSVLRLKTGGLVEKSFVFPVLIMINVYLFYTNYGKFLDLLKHYITK